MIKYLSSKSSIIRMKLRRISLFLMILSFVFYGCSNSGSSLPKGSLWPVVYPINANPVLQAYAREEYGCGCTYADPPATAQELLDGTKQNYYFMPGEIICSNVYEKGDLNKPWDEKYLFICQEDGSWRGDWPTNIPDAVAQITCDGYTENSEYMEFEEGSQCCCHKDGNCYKKPDDYDCQANPNTVVNTFQIACSDIGKEGSGVEDQFNYQVTKGYKTKMIQCRMVNEAEALEKDTGMSLEKWDTCINEVNSLEIMSGPDRPGDAADAPKPAGE